MGTLQRVFPAFDGIPGPPSSRPGTGLALSLDRTPKGSQERQKSWEQIYKNTAACVLVISEISGQSCWASHIATSHAVGSRRCGPETSLNWVGLVLSIQARRARTGPRRANPGRCSPPHFPKLQRCLPRIWGLSVSFENNENNDWPPSATDSHGSKQTA
jgi:hypothetical protein